MEIKRGLIKIMSKNLGRNPRLKLPILQIKKFKKPVNGVFHGGYYNTKTNTIILNKELLIKKRLDLFVKALIHEYVHYLQMPYGQKYNSYYKGHYEYNDCEIEAKKYEEYYFKIIFDEIFKRFNKSKS